MTVEHRLQALTLLCALLRFQPPHLYTVAQTPLIEHLLQCLMNDTSATAIELALMVLTMFLPHIPSSLTSHLPRLYLIYSRILCWERFGPTSSREDTATDLAEDYASGTGNNISPPNIDPDWPTLHHSFEEAESKTPELLHFFTFMYGLYPLNFMSYIRKPRKYLQNISFPGANDFDLDQSIIRKRTEQFQEQHILHPNFFNTTIEDELTDNRWIRSDPAEVVSVCVGLYIPLPIKLGDPGPPPTGKLPDIPEKYMRTEDIPSQELGATDNNESMSGSDHAVSRRQSGVRDAQSSALPSSRASIAPGEGLNPPTPSVQNQQQHGLRLSRATSASSRPRESSIFDSPTLPALSVGATDQGQLAKDASMTGIRSDRNGSVASLSSVGAVSPQLSVYPRASELNQQLYSPANTAGSQNQGMMAYLQEEVILLRSNLDFKRWQTQQHLAHIGQRQRKHINEAAVEAEMQDLRSTIRSLRAKLAKGGEAYTMLKKESAASRNHTKKWDAELTAKLEEVRESEKRWKSTEEQLRQDLRKAQKDCDHLRRLIEQSEARETLSHQKIETMKLDLEDLEKLRAHVQDLEEKVRDHQIQEMDFEQAKEEEEILRTELATASLRLQSSHAERERIKKAMDRKLADMESQLQASSRASSQIGSVPPDVQARLDDALAGSHAKVAQMKKAYERLNARFVALKLRYEELEGEHADDAEDTLSTLPSPRSYSRDLAFVPAEPLPFPTPPTGSFASDPPMRPLLASSDPAVYGEHIARNGNGLRSFSSAYSTIPAVRPSSSYPGHAPRHDSLPRRGTTSYLVPSAEHPTALRSASSSMASASEPAMLVSSSRSTRSVETATSEKYKGKIEPKSEVRVFGRGESCLLRCVACCVLWFGGVG